MVIILETTLLISRLLGNFIHRMFKYESSDLCNKDYYSEIISKYTPAELSYIDNFYLDDKDLVATLLWLQLKKKIVITDTINLIEYSTENLSSNEEYILNLLQENKLHEFSKKEFEFTTLLDCRRNNLVISSKIEVVKALIYMAIAILIFRIPDFIELNFLQNYGISNYTLSTAFMLLGFMLLSSCIWIMYKYESNPYVRNQQGKKINKQLEGLKKYLHDVSLLDEKEKEALSLWEDYLIYSVMFGQNRKIVDDIMKIIKS